MQQRERNKTVEGHRASTFAEVRFEPRQCDEEACMDNHATLPTTMGA